MTSFIIEVIIGVALAIATIYPGRMYYPDLERPLWAIGLFVAALIYIGFLFLGASGHWLWIEPAGAVIFGAMAYAGAKRFPLMVGIGWLCHGFWDVGLHLGEGAHFVPFWYPGVCLGYDQGAGIYLIRRART